MKVLMQSRKNFYSLRGGDTVQLLKTKTELEKLGVDVDISLEFEPDLTEYDLVHLSNVTRIQETYLHVKNAVKQNKPIALSTIYWPMEEFEKNGQVGIRKLINEKLNIDTEEKLKALVRYLKEKNARNIATKNLWKVGYTTMQRYVIDHADIFLPNSEMEMTMVKESFGVRKNNYVVVPNAIDLEAAEKAWTTPHNPAFEKYRDAVICVGRIEPRKNQLALVKALKDAPYKLVLVGGVSDNQKQYFESVMRYINAREDFYYIPQIDNTELYQLYKVCRVSTLPSWLDTPGLVSLEAAVMGCNLAVSSKGSTTEYFEDMAEYCLPDDLDSIRRSIDTAFQKENDGKLREKILSQYTWQEAARRTLKGYQRILEHEGVQI